MFLLFVVFLSLSLVCPLQAQTISLFKEVPDTSGFTAVAADASGVYAFSNSDVRKYDTRGTALWSRDFNDSLRVRTAIADGAGVYAIGYLTSGQTTVLRRYSTTGIEVWSRELENSYGTLALDATGVYVVTRSLTGGSSVLRKFSPAGAELWRRDFGDFNTFPTGGVAADLTGVYVISTASGSTAGAVTVRKWDSEGTDLWTRPLRSTDLPTRSAVSSGASGFYFIAQDRNGAGAFLRHHDAAGAELWSQRIDPTPDPNLVSITADATGAYVAGKLTGSYQPYRPYAVLPGQCRSGSGGDSFVRKYDADSGAQVWARQFGTSQASWASSVAVEAGSVYVVGEDGAAQVRDDFEHFEAFRPANPTRGSFLAKFETATAAVGASTPQIIPGCVVNAASYTGGGVAPGEIVTIFGSAIGPPELANLQVTGGRKLATTLAGTRILFDGVPAPLIYVSEKQSSAIVPYGVAGRASVDVQVEYLGVKSNTITTPVLDARPGIFTQDGSGSGPAAILNEDGTPNSPANPARRGSVITLFGTGGGETASGVEDGQIVSDVLPRANLPIWAMFDLANNEFLVTSKPAEILYAGGVPGAVAGLLQINLRVPENAIATGNTVPFLLIVGSHWTVYDVTVSIR